MKSRKGLVLTALVLFGSLFIAFRSINGTDSNEKIAQQQKLLNTVGALLEQQHYSPQKINDDFSRKIFKAYLSQLDGDKSIFIAADVNAVKKFETTIDDEIHGASIQFQPAVSAIYEKRVAETMLYYKDILSKPFDYSVNETVQLDGDQLGYTSTEAERKDRWRKKLKYYSLERFIDLQEEREKNKGNDSFKVLPDDSLELAARTSVLKMMDRTFNRIKTTFTEEQRFNSFINVITNTMDPHTDYYPPIEKRAFDERMSNQFYGIGAQLQQDDNGIKIASVVTGGPAWKSGAIVAGDIIIKVAQGANEPVDVSGYGTEDAVKLIRGDKGTEVRITFKKQDGTTKTVSLIREKIEQDEGLARSAVIMQGKDKIGYIALPDFYANFEDKNGFKCSEDVATEVKKLKAENVKGIVIDLRNNGGGSLLEVVKMVGLFIKTGPVVQVKERDGRVDQQTWRDNDESVLYDGPLTVMVNELSASASEIFAAAIQDYKRGIVIGSSSTYGKGTVQRPIPFGRPIDFYSSRTEFGAVSLTFQKFYRVNGGSTQLKGVVPDIIMPDTYEYLKIREKDNPNSLPWDAIPQTPYQPWQGISVGNLTEIIKKEQTRISSDANLILLQDNLKWLSKNNDNPINLQIDQFKQLQKQITNTVNQNNTLLKLKNEMSVQTLEADKDKFYNNPDKNKGIRYQEWLKLLKQDLQIDASAKIIQELATQQYNTAKN
ncbi:MAG: tail-specific protease [Sphingobacteriia bacterium 24-36-13]|uniref:carboxy terminal-processing peptidase n=1 Tax=Sediminibacterium sp. TaxID=1917865 RepID=UPI000BC407FB|nr:carboxy terminal-processing peptidase [Sediminibacterium sp.]OYY11690.1 MAG: tail-specific protease [Sphingobacteriia bacterium 35-36-14]OYZ53813.1 MAG: tail-specific protease [Sphingobacteriia bacterium 24-36-13]OZA65802.1 MAG: tail-specific protease [Sphingobacteriia bacterium 39-36-14]MBT9483215.1 carboxy terminal-processing peptidase [Sediminibacterium sp.]HQS24519.1 carboxy terminal-processing peptidase [Sediminibacterium sp.]